MNTYNQRKQTYYSKEHFLTNVQENYFTFLNFDSFKETLILKTKENIEWYQELIEEKKQKGESTSRLERTLDIHELTLKEMNDGVYDFLSEYQREVEIKIFKNKKSCDNEEWKVKQLCYQKFNKKFKYSLSTEEFTNGALKKRADIVYVSLKSIDVIEIKSKDDTLKRLLSQVDEYKEYANSIHVVMDIKHEKEYLKKYAANSLMDYCNIYFSDGTKISLLKKALKKPVQNKDLMVEFLWGDELSYYLSDVKYIYQKNLFEKCDLFREKYKKDWKEIILKTLFDRLEKKIKSLSI